MATCSSLDEDVKEWNAVSEDRPLKIVISGQAGIGKSTLINNFLGLEVGAETGKKGKATTLAVKEYEKVKNGIEVIIFDTPGLCDAGISEEKTLKDIGKVTAGEVDLLFYCVNLRIGRLNKGDVEAFNLLSKVFGKALWENTVFVLTFANEECSKDYYQELLRNLTKTIKETLKKEVGVPETQAKSIVVTVAGDKDEWLEYDGTRKNWKNDLLLASLRAAKPEAVPSLLLVQMNKEEWDMINAPKTQEDRERTAESAGKYIGIAGGGAGGLGAAGGVVYAGLAALTVGTAGIGGAVTIGGALLGAYFGPKLGKWLRHKELPELDAVLTLKHEIWKKQNKK